MSDRNLYQRIPVNQRTCSWCQEPIQRNIFKTPDGRLWHYGCLMNAKDTHYECQECWANFDGTEANLEENLRVDGDDWKASRKTLCPHCGIQVPNRSQAGVIEL